MRIKILDCTLRDGGYVNDWNFRESTIKSILSKLSESSINMIECGFLKSDFNYSPDKTLFNVLGQLEVILHELNISSYCVAMINYGEYSFEMLPISCETTIKGIRVVFHKSEVDGALDFAQSIMKKGYDVFVQPMATSTYTDDELLYLIKRVNAIRPYAFYIVDTLGSMYPQDLLRMFYLIDNNLLESVSIGFHSHNNLQLSFSSAQELLKVHTKRKIIIDSSVYGMGRGAGNLCTELIAQYINDNIDKRYNIRPILEIIDEHLAGIKAVHNWGYAAPYYISAVNQCHPNYASFLMNKQTITVKHIDSIIKKIPGSKKTVFDNVLAANLYAQLQAHAIDDSDAIKRIALMLKDREVLLLAPGKTLVTQKALVDEYINLTQPFVISINWFNDEFNQDAIFISNLKRYNDLMSIHHDEISTYKMICTSNVTTEESESAIIINYSDYTIDDTIVSDNAGLMAIKLLIKLGINQVACAGFDGFSKDESNNYYSQICINNVEAEELVKKTNAIFNELESLYTKIKVKFITESAYGKKAR